MKKYKCINKFSQYLNRIFRDWTDILKSILEEIRSVEELKDVQQRDLNYVSSATQAVLLQNPKGARWIVWGSFWFFIAALIWAAFAYIDEYTRGVGKVIPSRYLQIVQNLEGGILSELYVAEGDNVEVGEPLLRIDDTLFSSSFREQTQHFNQLEVRLLRLRAEAKGEIFAVGDVQPQLLDIFRQEENLFKSRRKEFKAKESQLLRSHELVSQELTMMRPLLNEGAISEVEVLRLERQANDLGGELESVRLSFLSQVQQELNEVAAEYARLSETMNALEDRVNRTVVRSPVSGQVKQIMVKTIGGVIQPGMDILEVVPTGDRLLIEAKVSPADIAFLHPGQKAIVKVTAYNFTVHGGLNGTLVHISPDTLLDDEGNSYYAIKVETEQGVLGENLGLPIIPGMTVEVEVLTGKKTILQYLLHPVLRAKSRALSER